MVAPHAHASGHVADRDARALQPVEDRRQGRAHQRPPRRVVDHRRDLRPGAPGPRAAHPRGRRRRRLEALYRRVVAIEFGSARPREVAFCSGSGNGAMGALLEAGVDTLVTGELREEWFNVAEERRLNLYLCGHYATEVHGVRALAAELSKKFGLPWEFIATENPL